MQIPRAGTSWDLLVENAKIGNTRITDETEDVSVAYVLTHKGESFGSGSMAWEAHDYLNTWVARITLPTTPGTLKAVITASATVDGDDVVGEVQTTIQVV